jgi:hypothetical protein
MFGERLATSPRAVDSPVRLVLEDAAEHGALFRGLDSECETRFVYSRDESGALVADVAKKRRVSDWIELRRIP